MSTEFTTLHMENDQTLVKPIDQATPVISTYQVNATALRGLWDADWIVLRAGAVQTITGVAW